MPDALKPIARSVRLRLLYWKARRRAARGPEGSLGGGPAAFVFACGRSGTTILGRVLSTHPGVRYLREPYHLWAAIDPALDVTNLHARAPARLWWDASDATDAMRARFARVILGERAGKDVLVEKTPHNVYRVGLLEALTIGTARYVHIVRDGADVARSIERICREPSYSMAWRRDYHQWWGSRGAKWERLRTEGPARGHFTTREVERLVDDAQRGAYEWLTSLEEADRWRAVLGERLLEIAYPELTDDPVGTMARVAAHVGAEGSEAWLRGTRALVRPERRHGGGVIELPSRMAARFNAFQSRHGFPGRASSLPEEEGS